MKTVLEPAREIPVAYEADVVVVGGGPAGIGAALGAARMGAKTVLLERFGWLGGMQTLAFNSNFSMIDPEIQGGILMDLLDRLKKGGAVRRDTREKTRELKGQGGVAFDCEYYKYLLDEMMAEAGVKVLFHVLGAGVLKEGNAIKGILIESKEGRHAVLGKTIVDSTGEADIAWKSGAPCMDEGYPSGPKAGRHMGYGYPFFIRGVDQERFKALKQEYPEEWNMLYSGKKLITKAKEEGRLHGNREGITIVDYGAGRVKVSGPRYPVLEGRQPWEAEEVSCGQIDLRKQVWSLFYLLKENVPGFENSQVDITPVTPQIRDAHRMIGDYILRDADMREGRAFEDSVAISNAYQDFFGPDDEHQALRDTLPFDIPYRSLVSKEIDNLLAAGSTISAEFAVYAATRYCVPSICTGQAAGTAAALAVRNNITPKQLDVKLLQETLRKDGVPTTVANVPKAVLAEYRESAKHRWASDDLRMP